MSEPINRTFSIVPNGPYSPYFPQFSYSFSYIPPERSIRETITYYLLRALTVIERIIRLLQSSSPFFEQYSPVLKQLPNMYKMIKLIQEVQAETEEIDETKKTANVQDETVRVNRRSSERNRKRGESKPTLFI